MDHCKVSLFQVNFVNSRQGGGDDWRPPKLGLSRYFLRWRSRVIDNRCNVKRFQGAFKHLETSSFVKTAWYKKSCCHKFIAMCCGRGQRPLTWVNSRDLKHGRRRGQRTTTGSKISHYCATAHARLVVHMKFRTPKRQVCRPERTWVCIYEFTECLR